MTMWIAAIVVTAAVVAAILLYVVPDQMRRATAEDLSFGYFEDGLIDVFLGGALVAAGLMIVLESGGMIAIWVPVGYILLLAAKRSITLPRISGDFDARLMRSRMNQLSLALAAAMLVGVGAFVVTVSDGLSDGWVPGVAAAVGAALAAGALGVVGMRTSTPRLIVYGAAVAIAWLGGVTLNMSLPWLLVAVGAVGAVAGLITTSRFVRRNPKQPRLPFPV